MEIGVCCSLVDAALAESMGFDYVELSACEMAAMEPWDPSVYDWLRVRALNLFLPPNHKIFREQFPHLGDNVLDHYRRVTIRSREIGVEVVVLGGGKQRSCPSSITWPIKLGPRVYFYKWADCCSADEAFARDLASKVIFILGDFSLRPKRGTNQSQQEYLDEWVAWDKARLKLKPQPLLAPEQLNRTETNVGTNCGSFARTLANYDLPYTADAYHILKEWDFEGREGGLSRPTKAFWEEQLPFAPAHVHVASLAGREAPATDDEMLLDFFRRLKELNFEGRVSLEVRTPFDELVGAADRVRELILRA